jgi:hypothetical protein
MSTKQKYLIKAFEICLIIFFIWFTFYGGYLIGSHFDKGWFISEDGYNFIESAKLFNENGLKIFIKSDLARQASISYIITIIIISFLIEIKNWFNLFIGMNLSLFFLSYFLLKNFLKKIAGKESLFYLNIVLILIYFSNYENFFYVRLILSDCIFSFFTLVFFLKILQNKKKLYDFFLISFIFVLIFFINPKFIAILFFVIFYILIRYFINKNLILSKNYIGTSLILTYIIGLFVWSVFYNNFNLLNFTGDIFLEIEQFYLDGTIIHNRSKLDYLESDVSILKIFYLGILRSLSFFQFWSLNWDLKHNLVNIISIMPLYLTNVLNIVFFNKYSESDKRIIIGIVAMIIAFVFMSSITAVDYDWRYRYPLYNILVVGLMIYVKSNIFKYFRF